MSNQPNALAQKFPMLGSFLAWKVGNGVLVRAGAYAIMGCDRNIILPKGMLQHLN